MVRGEQREVRPRRPIGKTGKGAFLNIPLTHDQHRNRAVSQYFRND